MLSPRTYSRRSSPLFPRDRHARMRFEPLESRDMLTAISAVGVDSTAWDSSFRDEIDNGNSAGITGYEIPTGSDQAKTVPWNNVDKIQIKFDTDVDVQAADLSVSGVNETAYEFDDFSYDATDKVATWTLAEAIAKDKIFLDLDADGIDPVKAVSGGAVLDGEWTDNSDTFPSGNGTAGGDFEFRINVLPGDYNGSATVTTFDRLVVASKVGKAVGDAGYDIRADINGDGDITTADDKDFITNHLSDALPSGDPEGVGNDAPTTTGLADVHVNAGAISSWLVLYDGTTTQFDDAEDDSDGLTYSVVGNTNESLIDTTSFTISESSGLMYIYYESGETGWADITVRATDTDGLFVDTTFKVHVNERPVIATFSVIEQPNGDWTISGTVTDDEDVAGLVVSFSGVLSSYGLTATVDGNGNFSITETLNGLVSGDALANVTDDDLFSAITADATVTV